MAAAKPHVLAVPLPAQGHLNPLMRLCKILASHDILITFVNVDCLHERIIQSQHTPHNTVQGAESNIRRDHIPFPVLDLSNDFKIPIASVLGEVHTLRSPLLQLIDRLSQEGPPITCIISDILLSSLSQEVAEKSNLPRIAFNTCSQSMNLFMFYISNGKIPLEAALHATAKRNADLFQYAFPGLPALRNEEVPHFKHVLDETERLYQIYSHETGIGCTKAEMVVVSSFEEAEGPAFSAMSTSEVPVYSMGPLIEELSEESSTSLWKEQADCLDWLDKQPAASVLYISLGSVTLLSEQQLEEILFGLEASHQRFLWAFRPGMVEGASCKELPGWFLSSTKDRGYVVSWAPQLQVLEHGSVSGFWTHCGWNSIMEGVANGVVMLCWPYFSEQALNCKLVVEEWKVGMKLGSKGGGGGGGVGRGVVEKTIRTLMEGEESTVLRNNAAQLCQKSRSSLSPGGSSHTHMQTLVQRLKQC